MSATSANRIAPSKLTANSFIFFRCTLPRYEFRIHSEGWPVKATDISATQQSSAYRVGRRHGASLRDVLRCVHSSVQASALMHLERRTHRPIVGTRDESSPRSFRGSVPFGVGWGLDSHGNPHPSWGAVSAVPDPCHKTPDSSCSRWQRLTPSEGVVGQCWLVSTPTTSRSVRELAISGRMDGVSWSPPSELDRDALPISKTSPRSQPTLGRAALPAGG